MLEKIILQENIDAVKRIVDAGTRFVVLSHKNPDGDAVASSLALCHYLRSLGKECFVVLPNRFPDFLAWMPGATEVLFYDAEPEKAMSLFDAADAFFCLDFNTLSRIGDG